MAIRNGWMDGVADLELGGGGRGEEQMMSWERGSWPTSFAYTNEGLGTLRGAVPAIWKFLR